MARVFSNGFDAHNHLDDPSFDAGRAAVCARARSAGVHGWAIAAADPAHWPRVLEVATTTHGIAQVGLHPWWAAELEDPRREAVLCALASQATPHGIGEIGLDFRRFGSPEARRRQELAFRAQLALAREREVPVVIHGVGAHGRLLALLAADGLPEAGGVWHGFSGAPEVAARALSLGLHLSFGPLLRDPRARRARAAVRVVPPHRLLLETDCTRPDRGQPVDLVGVAEAAAALRGEDAPALFARSGRAARALFGLSTDPTGSPAG